MAAIRNIVAGNWKMNTDITSGVALASAIAGGAASLNGVSIIVGPPFVSLAAVRDAVAGSGVTVAAQNMHADDSGAGLSLRQSAGESITSTPTTS